MDADTRRRLARFLERMKTMHEGPPYTALKAARESPRLQLVTADNAAQFQQAPKKRGRPRAVQSGSNVVEFRTRLQLENEARNTAEGRVDGLFRRFLEGMQLTTPERSP